MSKFNGNGHYGRRRMEDWELPSRQELNEVAAKLFHQAGPSFDRSFQPCCKNDCVDGWIHIPAESGVYPAIGHVERCECYYTWRRERLNTI